jgi:UPF0716 protein FxsA
VLLFVVVFVIAPIVEIYGIVQVGGALGGLATCGLLVLGAIIGTWLVRHEGVRLFRRFIEQIAARQAPSTDIAEGVVTLAAGVLLIAPGFISDLVAVILLIPTVRRAGGRYLVRRYTAKGGTSRIIRARYHGRIVDATSTESSPRRPSRPGLLPGSDDPKAS